MTKSSEREMRVYSAEEKLQAIKDLETLPANEVSENYGVSKSTLYWWKKRHEAGADLSPQPRGGAAAKWKRTKAAKRAPRQTPPKAEIVKAAPRGTIVSHATFQGMQEVQQLRREIERLKRVISTLLE